MDFYGLVEEWPDESFVVFREASLAVFQARQPRKRLFRKRQKQMLNFGPAV